MTGAVTRLRGRCWTFGDNVPTDAMVKSEHIFEPMDVIVQHVLEDHDPDFPREVADGDLVVAGEHFGQSSGRAIAPKAVQATGVAGVVAESFARTFYRNAFEIGLPVLPCPGITDLVERGDVVAVDLESGRVVNEARGDELACHPVDPFLLDMVAAGGVIELARGGLDGLA